MALNRPALVDALTEAGLEAEAVRSEMTTEFAAVRSEMQREFAAVRSEMAREFAAVRSEMATEFAGVRRELTLMRWMIGVLFVTQGTTLGIVAAKLL